MSDVIMAVENPYMNCSLMAIVIFTLSVTIFKIFIVKMYMTLTLTLKWSKVKCKYTSQKPMYDFPFIVNGNLYHVIVCKIII